MRKKYPWFEIALSIVFLSAYVYAAFSDAYNLPNRWFIRDDAYYYFKVAQNISEGHGSTFDGIHPTNGYHPLWMLICVPIFALARYDVILPLRVLVLVTGVLQIATAILLYRLIRSAVSPPAAMLAAAYWVFSTYILLFLYKTGVELSIGLFFIVLLIHLTYKFEQTWRASRAERRTRVLAGGGRSTRCIQPPRPDLLRADHGNLDRPAQFPHAIPASARPAGRVHLNDRRVHRPPGTAGLLRWRRGSAYHGNHGTRHQDPNLLCTGLIPAKFQSEPAGIPGTACRRGA